MGDNNGGHRGVPMKTQQSQAQAAQQLEYAEEALRAAQRHIDQVNQITEMTKSLDEWRTRATLAENEIERRRAREQEQNIMIDNLRIDAVNRERQLLAQISEEREEFMHERERINKELTILQAHCHSASKIILDAFGQVERVQGMSHEHASDKPLDMIIASGAQHEDDAK